MDTTERDGAGLRPSIRYVIGVDEAGRGCMAGPVGVAATLYRISATPVRYAVLDSKKMKEIDRAETLEAMCAELSDAGVEGFVGTTVRDGTCCLVRYQRRKPLQAVAAALVDVSVINERNILNATLEGMSAVCDAVVRSYNAVSGLDTLTPLTCAILIDGNRVPWTFLSGEERQRVCVQAVRKVEARKRIGVEYPALDGFGCTTVVKGDATLLSIAAASIVAKVARDAYAVSVMHRAFPQYGFNHHKGYCTAAHKAELARWGPSHFHRLDYAPVKGSLGGQSGDAKRTPALLKGTVM
ncbi:ribonuclease HII [Leishmania donovani]|uniref:Ribonuclease n=2 Tax=Leishmania donovani TaxID=5661 RepID=A0A504XRI3_LEIDO|nr:Ribonuclease HII family protein [Leishmania donovani]CAJ1987101.1 ribonuclease HII [Leishmania donovani]